MATITAEELIGENLNPVSLPVIVENINQLLQNPNSNTTDILQEISYDPVLTSRILKFVNSPFYNFPSQVDTLSKAVTILGTQALRDLVIANTIIRHFHFSPEIDFDLETFWCHSIAAGIAARAIAHSQNSSYPEQFFIAGLLHDIGKLVMAMLLPGETESLNRININTRVIVEHPEEQIFGFSHEQLGNKLMENWNFPELISKSVLHHHDLECDDESRTETAILHIANIIANNIQAPFSNDDDTILDQAALDILGIDQETIDSSYEEVYNVLDDTLQLLYYEL